MTPLSRVLLMVCLCTFVPAMGSETDADRNPSEPQVPGEVASNSTVSAGTPEKPRLFPGDRLFNAQAPFLAGVILDQDDARYEEGELLSLSFQAEQPCYLYLLYHQADGVSSLLFPNSVQSPAVVPARERIKIPAADARYRFRIRGPFGREVLQVLATLRAIPELDALVVEKKNGVPQVGSELLDKLAERLLQEPSQWSEHRVTLQTYRKGAPETVDLSGDRVALCIGVGQYQNPKLMVGHPELAASAELMFRELQAGGQISREKSRLLLNEQATRSGIEDAITCWLPSVSRPGDTVFIYMAGNGRQFPTSDPTEPDGKDEALCPFDAGTGDSTLSPIQETPVLKSTCLLDDELARWIQELSNRQVVLIVDTCHSGGFAATKQDRAGWLDEESARLKDISQLNTIVLTSCAADETSQLLGPPSGTSWLTQCFVELFRQAKPISVQEAYLAIKERMRVLRAENRSDRPQEPQLIDRALLPIPLIPATTAVTR